MSVSSAGAVPPGVCVLRLREAAPGGHNTRVYRGSEVATAAVHFPPRCGIALSPDRAWIVIRLNPYRVGRYGFRVVFRFVRAGGLAASGSAMALRFMYEHVVPPVVITHCRVRLDPSGGELLQIPVENVLSPPRKTPLKKHHFVLKLFSGADLVALLKPVDMVRIGRTPRHILRFRTNPIRGKYGRLRIVLETPGSNAVIDPRHNVTIAVMSRRTAVLDQCTPDVADKRFVKISMRVPYNRATFTEWKNVLMKRALTHFFSARGDDRIRLVGVGRDIVTYAVLVSGVDRKHALDARILEMNRAVRNGSFADAVHAWQHHLSAREVVYMNTSMCAAFPHLVAGVSLHEIRGLQISLLPLCTSFPIALGFIITILLAQNSPAKSRETVSSYRSKVSTEEGSTNCEFSKAYYSKADSEETCYAPVCSYPSEAREKFARRYGLRDKITSDNLRDSDLESTVDGEQKEGVGKLVDVFRKFGQSFGGLGHIWRKLRGYEAQEVQISARTASTNRSPTIYIERVSYDCDSHSVGYG